MKLHGNPDKLFFFTVMFATVTVGLLLGGSEGFKGTQACKPFAQFFCGVIFICLGPWGVAMALKVRASEGTLTLWKQTWLVGLGGAILFPLGGVAMLWKLFAHHAG